MTILVEWAYTLFSRAFNFRIVSKIWDLFLVFGDVIFLKVAVSII